MSTQTSYVFDELRNEAEYPAYASGKSGLLKIQDAPKESGAIYAFPCFQYAKSLDKNPIQVAEELAQEWNKMRQSKEWPQKWFPDSVLDRFEASRGYVNVFPDKQKLHERILKDLHDHRENYGSYPELHQTMVVDYCSPNIAKPLSVGHLRSTIIGQALINILKARGYKVVGINFMGDWGTQFGKLIYAFEQWGNEKKLEDEPIQHLLELYVRFHKEAKENPALEDDARAAFKRLQQGGEKERALWQRFRESSLEVFEKTVARLGVKFDHNWFESDFEERAHVLIERLLDEGIAERSEGAVIIRTFEDKPPLLAQKSDGTTLYASRDLASALARIEGFKSVGKLIYVVGSEQTLHFENLGIALDFILFVNKFSTLLAAFDTLSKEIKYRDPPIEYLRTLYHEFEKKIKENPSLEAKRIAIYNRYISGSEKEAALWSAIVNIILKDKYQPNPQIYNPKAKSLNEFEDFILTTTIFYGTDMLEKPEEIKAFLRSQLRKTIEARESPPEFPRLSIKELEAIFHHILEHDRFGMVSLPTGKISTREGRIVYLDELLDEAERRAQEIIKEKNPDMPKDARAQVARKVGIGAVIYADLSQDRIKDIVFDWSKMLAFEGNSAPYLQYAAVRCARILAKASPEDRKRLEEPKDADIPRMVAEIEEPESIELLMHLGRFPQAIAEAAERYAPHALASYLYDLAAALSRFYTKVPVLKAQTDAARLARLTLVEATGRVLRRGLALLGIETPEEM